MSHARAPYALMVKHALHKRPMTVHEILFYSALPLTKQVYIIKALKKCMEQGTVVQDPCLDETRMYDGKHMYRMVPTLQNL